MHLIKREMGCTVEDLERWLPHALGKLYLSANVELNGKSLLHAQNPLVAISGISRPSRKIALLDIPVLDLRILFSQSLSTVQIEEALKRFDLYTRRGGG